MMVLARLCVKLLGSSMAKNIATLWFWRAASISKTRNDWVRDRRLVASLALHQFAWQEIDARFKLLKAFFQSQPVVILLTKNAKGTKRTKRTKRTTLKGQDNNSIMMATSSSNVDANASGVGAASILTMGTVSLNDFYDATAKLMDIAAKGLDPKQVSCLNHPSVAALLDDGMLHHILPLLETLLHHQAHQHSIDKDVRLLVPNWSLCEAAQHS
jgi:hypothetical protein